MAQILVEIGTLLELKGENPFKTRAYANAARTIEGLGEPLAKLVAEKRLGEIKGIGEALEQKITELVETGRLKYYEELKKSIPAGLMEMLEIPGLGPKKIQALRKHLMVESVEQLEAACKAGKVAELDGFGEKTQTNLLEGIARRRLYASKHLLMRRADGGGAHAGQSAGASGRDPLQHGRAACGGPRKSSATLTFWRRRRSRRRSSIFSCTSRASSTFRPRATTKASVILEGGIQADLRVVSDKEYPFALVYFTGSKEHNIVMRQRAIARGLRLNEYGLFKSKEETRDPKLLVACRDEAEVFEKLDLACVPPELREDHGEFEAAEKGTLPRLIEWGQLKGSLHNHSTWSDGHNTLEEIGGLHGRPGPAILGHHGPFQVFVPGQRPRPGARARADQGDQEGQRRADEGRQRVPAVDRQRGGHS